MKKIIFTIMLVAMIGCSNITFDGLQYDRYISLHETASKLKEQCGHPLMKNKIQDLKLHTDHMNMYAKLRSNSPEVLVVTDSLTSMVDEMNSRYAESAPSVAYCQEKLNNIAAGSHTVAATLGAQ